MEKLAGTGARMGANAVAKTVAIQERGHRGHRGGPQSLAVAVVLAVAGVISGTALGGCVTLNGPGGDLGAEDGGTPPGSGGTATDGGVGTSSGVVRAVRLADLTSGPAAVLCDWVNEKQGGYGRTAVCGLGVVATNPTRDDCLGSTSALGNKCLSLTVGHIEDCANATGTDLCKLQSAPACLAITGCSM